jgi:hypothetical protein
VTVLDVSSKALVAVRAWDAAQSFTWVVLRRK